MSTASFSISNTRVFSPFISMTTTSKQQIITGLTEYSSTHDAEKIIQTSTTKNTTITLDDASLQTVDVSVSQWIHVIIACAAISITCVIIAGLINYSVCFVD